MKKLFILASAALAMVACDKNDDIPVPSSVAAGISASIDGSRPTRTNNNKWSTGDEIGVTLAVNDSFVPYINFKYITPGEESFTGNPIYFYDPMVVTAYYPFSGTEGITPGLISATTDADNQTSAKQSKIDFLWDQQSSIHNVNGLPEIHFSFTHKMSKITFIFENDEDINEVDVSKIVSYRVDGLKLDGTFNPTSGVCAVNDDAVQTPLSISLADVTVESGKAVPSLIVFPQTPGSNNVTLHLFANEFDDTDLLQHYSCNLSFEDGELAAGCNYVYKIKVSKAGLIINKSSITAWVDKNIDEVYAGSAD